LEGENPRSLFGANCLEGGEKERRGRAAAFLSRGGAGVAIEKKTLFHKVYYFRERECAERPNVAGMQTVNAKARSCPPLTGEGNSVFPLFSVKKNSREMYTKKKNDAY